MTENQKKIIAKVLDFAEIKNVNKSKIARDLNTTPTTVRNTINKFKNKEVK